MFRVDGDVQMITLVSKKWRYSCSCMRSVVVGEFSKWKKFGPIVLLVVAVDLEILFQSLVHSFGLTISFRMITGGEVEFHVQGLA